MTNTSDATKAPNELVATLAAKNFWASQEPRAVDVPGFRLLLDAAARQVAARRAAGPWRWSAVAVASVAAAAIAVWLTAHLRTPTLQDDLALARTVSFESVWRSPSDRLLAKAPTAVMHDMPDMPQFGTPNLAEEYL
jgi:hypothetical protein